VFLACARSGLDLDLLNVGGGFPRHYRTPVPPIAAYAEVIGGAIPGISAVPRRDCWSSRGGTWWVMRASCAAEYCWSRENRIVHNGAGFTLMRDATAIERILAGLEKKNRLLSPKEREIVAYHEMGHALVALILPGIERVQKVSIIPRGVGALGYTIQRPTEDRFLLTEEELENKMAVLLGGRAAERLVFGKVSTGAADDLAKVSEIARSYVAQYGMVGELGEVAYDRQHSQFLQGAPPTGWLERSYSEETAREIDCAVRETVARAMKRATSALEGRRDLLEQGAKALLAKETLSVTDLQDLVSPSPAKTPLRKDAAAA